MKFYSILLSHLPYPLHVWTGCSVTLNTHLIYRKVSIPHFRGTLSPLIPAILLKVSSMDVRLIKLNVCVFLIPIL